MPDPSTYYVETGYVEPGYFESEPVSTAPPKIERITIFKEYYRNLIFKEIDKDRVDRFLDENVVYRPINRTLVDVIITAV